MFGLVSRKKADAEAAELAAAITLAEARADRNYAVVSRQLAEIEALKAAGEVRLRKTVELDEALAASEVRRLAAETETARIAACHAGRVRIGSIPVFDAIEMTARLRAVEGSLRCEADGAKIVAYGDLPLIDAQWNALVAAATPQWDRT